MRMKCIIVRQIGAFDIDSVNLRPPSNGEIVLQVNVTGLCRTDLKLIRVGHRDLVLPRIPGEEVVGTVCEIGPGVSGIQLGQMLYVYPGIWCGQCNSCKCGAENLCKKMQIMGFHRDGGFAEYVIAPTQSLIPVPQNLTAEEAVFAEPLSCCLNALELAHINPGNTIAIWGAGPAGTLLSRAARAAGATPFVIEPDQRRCSLIEGYRSPPDSAFDICVIAVGSSLAYQEALTRLKPRGRLVVFSGLPPDSALLPTDFNQLHYHEQTIVGAYGCCYRHGKQALDLISNGKVHVTDMISHRMSLWNLEQALSIVENRKGMKVHLYPTDNEVSGNE